MLQYGPGYPVRYSRYQVDRVQLFLCSPWSLHHTGHRSSSGYEEKLCRCHVTLL